MNKRILQALTIGALTFLVASCAVVSPTNATLVNNRYHNRFFDFQIQIPQGWIIARNSQTAEAATKTANKLSKEEKRAEEAAYEFLISDQPINTSAQFMHSVSLSSVDCSWDKSSRATEDYLDSFVGDFVERAHFRPIASPVVVKLGGKSFYRADLELNAAPDKLHMTIFVTNKKGHILLMVISANSEAEIEKVLTLIGLTETKVNG